MFCSRYSILSTVIYACYYHYNKSLISICVAIRPLAMSFRRQVVSTEEEDADDDSSAVVMKEEDRRAVLMSSIVKLKAVVAKREPRKGRGRAFLEARFDSLQNIAIYFLFN